ncbi:MAG TPA: glycosyl transferase family 2, partial [Azospirillaceae bacterium]|nr:glycosyl transferase family 2 [Azospirillaceae bacterium]
GEVLMGHVNLFNGALIHRRVVETIGNVKREMFIWGDEYEYLLRAKRHGVRMGIALGARHFHPANRRSTRQLLGGWFGNVEIMPEARVPFFFRNLGYIQATYDGPFAVLRTLVKYTGFFLVFERGNVKGATRFWRNYLAGVFDRYPGELRGADAAPHPLRAPVMPRSR